MCTKWRLKSSGPKQKVLKRLVKHLHASSRGVTGLRSRIECILGEPVRSGLPNGIRRTYTDNYTALDHFDRDWYFIRFFDHSHDWESFFTWSLIHCAIINARAVWCAKIGRRVTVKEFMAEAVRAYCT